MKIQGKVRRSTILPARGETPERLWIGVREDSNPLGVHNLFISPIKETFTKGDPIEWDDERVYANGNKYKIIQKSPGLLPSQIQFPSFRP